MTNPNTEYNSQQRYVGTLGYVYNNSGVKVHEPFKKVKIFNPKPLAIIKDVNFSIAPNQLSFTTQLDRQYNEMLRRNLNNPNQSFSPNYNKYFRWSRNYQYSHNISRGIKFDFTSNVMARIEEPEGRLDKDMDDYKIRRDSIMQSLSQLGTTTDYGHNLRLSYNVPINKLPGLGWINANVTYTGQYNWNIGPRMLVDTLDLGNTIQNSNNKQLALGFSFNRLFLKSKYIDDIHKKFKKPLKERFNEKDIITKEYTRSRLKIKAEEKRIISHNLETLDVTVTITNADNKTVKCEIDIQSPNRIAIIPEQDVVNGTIKVIGKVPKSQTPLRITTEYLTRIITGLQNVNFSYGDNIGSMLDGYNQKADYLGSNSNLNNFAPGWGYIAGFSGEEYIEKVLENNWLSTNITEATTKFYTLTFSQNINLKATFEPLSDLQVMVDWTHRSSENMSRQYFRKDSKFDSGPPAIQGNYSVSYASYRTFFYKTDKKTFANKAFDDFLKYRKEVAWAIANYRKSIDTHYNPDKGEYPEGYNEVHSDVLLYAFKTAYSGTSPTKFEKGPGSIIPSILSVAPGWRIDYKGLTKIDYFAKKFKSVVITHTYLSNFTVGNYQTNPAFISNEFGYTTVPSLDIENPYYVSEFITNSIAFQESFNPIIGINTVWKNSLNTGFNYKKDRNIALNMTNNTITELHSWDITIRTGYTLKDIPMVIKTGGSQKKFVSNVNIQGDFSIRNNVTYNRQISVNITERTAGKINYAFKVGADYQFDRNLNIRAFYEHTVDKPWVSTSFRTVRAKFGFTVNYRLTE
jgi:cell surface protein SprA